MKKKIVIFTSKNCAPCHALTNALKKESIPFEEVDVNKKENKEEVIKCNVRATPTIVEKNSKGDIINSIPYFMPINKLKATLGL